MKNDFVVIMGVNMLQLQSMGIETQHLGKHPFIFLALVRHDAMTCVEVKNPGLLIILPFAILREIIFPLCLFHAMPEQSSADVEFEQETEMKDILKATFGRCFRILPVALLRMCTS